MQGPSLHTPNNNNPHQPELRRLQHFLQGRAKIKIIGQYPILLTIISLNILISP
jgi:hypothetical protein